MALRYAYANQRIFTEVCSHSYALDEVDTAIKATAGRAVEGAIHVTVDPWK